MRLLRQSDNNYSLGTEWLWQKHEKDNINEVFNAPEKTYLCFGIFLIDKLKLSEPDILDSIFKTVTHELDYWEKRYPWFDMTGFSLRRETMPDSTPYLYGYKCTQDNSSEESALIVGILHKLAQDFSPEIFMKVCDTDGDFIMSDCHEVVPEEFNYPIANNRLWVHEGKFKLIPTYFYPQRGLDWNEALEFLTKAYYKMVTEEKLMKKIDELYIKEFPKARLSNLQTLDVKISDKKILDIIKENPSSINFILKELKSSEGEDVSIPNTNYEESTKCTLLASRDSINLLLMFMEMHDLSKDKEKIKETSGELISTLLKRLLDDNTLLIEKVEDYELADTDDTDSLFEKSNFQKRLLDGPIDLPPGLIPEEKYLDIVKDFLTQDFRPPKNQDEDENSSDEDAKAADYLKSENTDIDEDYFFEYFLQNGLKLSPEKITELRQQFPKATAEEPISVRKDNVIDSLNDMINSIDLEDETTKDEIAMLESLWKDGLMQGRFEDMVRDIARNYE
ncbi:hypothetical protein C6P45_000350 [Maudiozyma exigua]|uniref:Uncharacterized protein n=1 Tax=Maudiozyma exigua TaxID=34358 RepID=A0A9P6WDP7_MAUEX|nr:hypothetical protein C6P45_000350 [Kazachstania exigua]